MTLHLVAEHGMDGVHINPPQGWGDTSRTAGTIDEIIVPRLDRKMYDKNTPVRGIDVNFCEQQSLGLVGLEWH